MPSAAVEPTENGMCIQKQGAEHPYHAKTSQFRRFVWMAFWFPYRYSC